MDGLCGSDQHWSEPYPLMKGIFAKPDPPLILSGWLKGSKGESSNSNRNLSNRIALQRLNTYIIDLKSHGNALDTHVVDLKSQFDRENCG